MAYEVKFLKCVEPFPPFEVMGKWRVLYDQFISDCADLGICPQCHNLFTGYRAGVQCQCGFPEDDGEGE